MWWVRQLLSPLTYLRIRLGEGTWYETKRFYDYVLPAILGLLTTYGYFSLIPQPVLLGEHGLLNSISGLLQLLVAFFIAALAAVATFPRESMDKPLRGSPAHLKRWSNAQQRNVDVELSRRQFVCYLFGYLSFLSLALFLAIIVADAVWPHVAKSLGDDILHYLKLILTGVLWIAFWNVLIQTVLGLYFLADRMQQDDDTS